MKNMIIVMILSFFCLSGSEKKEGCIYTTVFGSAQESQLPTIISCLDAFMRGKLVFFFQKNQKCSVWYPNYQNASFPHITSFEDVHVMIFSIYRRIGMLSQKQQSDDLKDIFITRRIFTQKDIAAIQAIRLYDFMNGKISYPQSIEKKGRAILTSPVDDQTKRNCLKQLDGEIDYALLQKIINSRTEYIQALGDKKENLLVRKKQWQLDWEYQPIGEWLESVQSIRT